MTKPPLSLGEDMGRRVLTGLIGAPIVIVMTFAGSPLFELGVSAVGLIAVAELAQMIRLGAAQRGAVLSTVRLFGGVAYIGGAIVTISLIRGGAAGLHWTLLLLLSSWGTDSFALLGGRRFGKHLLAPRISPKKTVEGALIGLFAGLLVGLIVTMLTGLPTGLGLIASILVPLATEAGDLLESQLKRQLGVKDSGHLLPGHGGFLDRIDGLLLAAPSLYLLLLLITMM